MKTTMNQKDAEMAAMISIGTRSYNLRRASLESEMAAAFGTDPAVVRECRRLIGECDRALMELSAGRLPTF